jgi:hypothetical protein
VESDLLAVDGEAATRGDLHHPLEQFLTVFIPYYCRPNIIENERHCHRFCLTQRYTKGYIYVHTTSRPPFCLDRGGELIEVGGGGGRGETADHV